MSVNDRSVASRQFVASSVAYTPAWEKLSGPKATKYWLAGFVVIVVLVVLVQSGPRWGIHVPSLHINPVIGLYATMIGVVVATAAIGGYLFWRSRRKYLLTVTNDGLTIDGRRGEVYPFADAQLGLWVGNGVVLHLRCGRRRFLLGGRDRRLNPATPLSAPPVQLVDAWLSESEFDELLSADVRWSRFAASGPAEGQQTRCLVFPNPLLIQQMGPFAFLKKQRLMASLTQPQLFIDVDSEGIRVIDAESNAVNAAISTSQLTATPATYQLSAGRMFPSAENIASDAAGQYFSTMPAMTVSIDGMQPLTIGCRDFDGLRQRFWWSGAVPVTNDPPPYTVSASDWLILVEKCGLRRYLEDARA